MDRVSRRLVADRSYSIGLEVEWKEGYKRDPDGETTLKKT